MNRLLAVASLCVSGAVAADHCATPRPAVVKTVDKVNADKVVIADPAAYVAPAYGASYSNVEALLLRLIETQERHLLATQSMHRDLLAGGRVAAPVKALAAIDVKRAKCASCHAEDIADDKGRGFVLTLADGSEALLGPNDLKRVGRRVSSQGGDRMPPAPAQALTPEERQAITQPAAAPPK